MSVDNNRSDFGGDPARAPWSQARRIAFRGARFVALAALGVCAATGAVFWLGILHSLGEPHSNRRELSCLTPEAFDRLVAAVEPLHRPMPEVRLVLADRGGQELICASYPPDHAPAAGPLSAHADVRPDIFTTLVVRAAEPDRSAGAAGR